VCSCDLQDEKFGCYLFDCGSPSVCVFSSHVGYSSFDMVTGVVDTHASDLASLASVPLPTEAWTSSTSSSTPAGATDVVTGLFCVCCPLLLFFIVVLCALKNLEEIWSCYSWYAVMSLKWA